MGRRNWGLVRDGATFEGLMQTLVWFEDSSAVPFGRPGKDGGQDMLSGDSRTVFQAKFHRDESFAGAIADAKCEAKKISEYRLVGHSREPQWRGVTSWILVTNARINPTDLQKWKQDVEPLFAAQGLVCKFWAQETLDSRLDEHPEVDAAYFEDRPRALLTLSEAIARLAPGFLSYARTVDIRGREEDLAAIATFLDGEQVVQVVSGPGGIGKTRVLIEAAKNAIGSGWQAFWANISTMEAGDAWYRGVFPERRTLLLVDEPDDVKLLKQLMEQVGGASGRASKWKLLVSVRNPKDHVVRYLKTLQANVEAQLRQLEAPSVEAVVAFVRDLLGRSETLALKSEAEREDIAARLSTMYGRYPIWITLAVRLLETVGSLQDLPTKAEDLAGRYLREVYEEQKVDPPKQVERLIRHIALLGPINCEDVSSLSELGKRAQVEGTTALLRMMDRLTDRSVLFRRGARDRLIEMKPDVLRDHVLHQWLFYKRNFGGREFEPTDDALELAREIEDALVAGTLASSQRQVLTALARLDWQVSLRGQDTNRDT